MCSLESVCVYMTGRRQGLLLMGGRVGTPTMWILIVKPQEKNALAGIRSREIKRL